MPPKSRSRVDSQSQAADAAHQTDPATEENDPLTLASIDALITKHFNAAELRTNAAELRTNERFDRLETQLNSVNDALKKHDEEIAAQRTASAKLTTRVKRVEQTMVEYQEQHADALFKIQEQQASIEDRNRRDNLRILHLKEGQEGSNAIAYLVANIPKWFPSIAAEWRPALEIMRAHRVGPYKPNSKTPRVLMVKFLRFTDRDSVLKKSRETPVDLAGQTLRFTADYSEFTAKRRKPCYAVMDRGRNLGCEAFLLYPATIKFVHESVDHLYSDLQEAKDFLDSIDTNLGESEDELLPG